MAPPLATAALAIDDVARLPAVAWPRIALPTVPARALLALLDVTQGSQADGLLTLPRFELLLDADRPGRVHRVEVLLRGEFVRVATTAGERRVYSVRDVARLLALGDLG